jgi:Bacterial membrane protein YfhO
VTSPRFGARTFNAMRARRIGHVRAHEPEPATTEGPTCTRWELVAGALFVGLLTLIFFGSILTGKTLSNIPSTQQLNAPWRGVEKPSFFFPQADQANLYYPQTVLETNAWRSGTMPFWNPYSLGGVPLLANGQSGVAYPVRIVLALVVSPLINHDVIVVLHVFLSGFFMFLLLKEFRLRLLPALLGAAAWMFAGWNSGLMNTEVTLIATTWLPAALLLIHRASRTRSWRTAAAAGIPLGLMALGGQLQLVAIAFGVCGIYAAALAVKPLRQWRTRWPFDRARLAYPMLTLGIAGGLAAVTLLPTALYVGQGGRQAPSYPDFVRNHTMSVDVFSHVFSGGPATPPTLVYLGMFVGLIPIFLAFVGCLRRRPGAALGRWLAIGTFLVAIGARGVTRVAYYLVPGVSRLSSTGQAMWLFDFGVVLLAAIGLDAVLEWSVRAARKLHARQPTLARWSPRVAVVLAVLAVGGTAWQLMDYAWYLNPPFTPKTQRSAFFPTTPAISAVQRDRAQRSAAEPQRLIGFSALVANQSVVFGLEDADGYDSVVSNRVRSLWYVIEGLPVDAAINQQKLITSLGFGSGFSASFITIFQAAKTRFALLPRVGITTIIADSPTAGALLSNPLMSAPLQLKPIYFGGDASVLNLIGSDPRAWVVHEADVAPNASDALRRFTATNFDYRSRMVVEPDVGLGNSGRVSRRGTGPSTIATRDALTPNGTTFTVRTGSPGWLVMADMYAPGWHVTVNGRDAKLVRSDYTLRAVAIPAGRSRVALSYRPPGFALGLVISGITLVSVVTLAVSTRLRGRRKRSSRRRQRDDRDIATRCPTEDGASHSSSPS